MRYVLIEHLKLVIQVAIFGCGFHVLVKFCSYIARRAITSTRFTWNVQFITMTHIHYSNCFMHETAITLGNLNITSSVDKKVYSSPSKLENSALVSMDSIRISYSTSHLLMQAVHDWVKVLDSCDSSHCLFLDFTKAFDSVPHQRLLLKLEYLGIGGDLLSWFDSYLTDYYQCVVISGHYSEWLPVLSGVPQGLIIVYFVY